MHNWFHGSRSYFGNSYASRTKFGSPSQLLSFGGFACNLNLGSIAEVRGRKSSSIHCRENRKVFVGLPRKIISKVEAEEKSEILTVSRTKHPTTTDWSRQKQVCLRSETHWSICSFILDFRSYFEADSPKKHLCLRNWSPVFLDH